MVTELPPLYLGERTFQLRFSSDLPDPTFYIWRGGQFLGSTKRGTWNLIVDEGDRADVDVLDVPGAPSYAVPFKGSIWWQGDPRTAVYSVQQYVGAAWVEVANVLERGETVYKWETPFLENYQTHEFRIIATDPAGNESEALALSLFVVRRPEFTPWTYTYDSGTGRITVYEA